MVELSATQISWSLSTGLLELELRLAQVQWDHWAEVPAPRGPPGGPETGVDVFLDVHVAGGEGCPNWSNRLETLRGAFLGQCTQVNSEM